MWQGDFTAPTAEMSRDGLSKCKKQEFMRGKMCKPEPLRFLMHSSVFMWVKTPVLGASWCV